MLSWGWRVLRAFSSDSTLLCPAQHSIRLVGWPVVDRVCGRFDLIKVFYALYMLRNIYVSICVWYTYAQRHSAHIVTICHPPTSFCLDHGEGTHTLDILCLRSPIFGQANIIKYFQVDIVRRTAPASFACSCGRLRIVDFCMSMNRVGSLRVFVAYAQSFARTCKQFPKTRSAVHASEYGRTAEKENGISMDQAYSLRRRLFKPTQTHNTSTQPLCATTWTLSLPKLMYSHFAAMSATAGSTAARCTLACINAHVASTPPPSPPSPIKLIQLKRVLPPAMCLHVPRSACVRCVFACARAHSATRGNFRILRQMCPLCMRHNHILLMCI